MLANHLHHICYLRHLSHLHSPHTLAFTELILILIGVVSINQHSLFPGYWAILSLLGSALLIYAGPDAWINSRVLSNRFLVWLGLISFPVYLWHWPILTFLRILKGSDCSITYRVTAVVLSIGLAWITYVLVERPIRFGAHPKLKAGILAVLMIIVGYIGFNTYVRDGLTFRLNQIQFRLPTVLQSLGQPSNPNTQQSPKSQTSHQEQARERNPPPTLPTLLTLWHQVNQRKPKIISHK